MQLQGVMVEATKVVDLTRCEDKNNVRAVLADWKYGFNGYVFDPPGRRQQVICSSNDRRNEFQRDKKRQRDRDLVNDTAAVEEISMDEVKIHPTSVFFTHRSTQLE